MIQASTLGKISDPKSKKYGFLFFENISKVAKNPKIPRITILKITNILIDHAQLNV